MSGGREHLLNRFLPVSSTAALWIITMMMRTTGLISIRRKKMVVVMWCTPFLTFAAWPNKVTVWVEKSKYLKAFHLIITEVITMLKYVLATYFNPN